MKLYWIRITRCHPDMEKLGRKFIVFMTLQAFSLVKGHTVEASGHNGMTFHQLECVLLYQRCISALIMFKSGYRARCNSNTAKIKNKRTYVTRLEN